MLESPVSRVFMKFALRKRANPYGKRNPPLSVEINPQWFLISIGTGQMSAMAIFQKMGFNNTLNTI